MKKSSSHLILSFSIIIAALIVACSVIAAAKIISGSISVIQPDNSSKIASEVVKVLRGPAANGAPEPGSKFVEGVTSGDNPLKGKVDAPVLMVEFSDFQCPFSKRFFQVVLPQIEKEYIATGKVKFAYRDLALDFHPFARPAAIAARCAGEQGKYWEMFGKLAGGQSLDETTIKTYVQELDLNEKAYQKCQEAPELSKALENDLQDAEKFGAHGTPSFFINGRLVEGAVPFDVFKKIIDEELEKSDKGK